MTQFITPSFSKVIFRDISIKKIIFGKESPIGDFRITGSSEIRITGDGDKRIYL